MLDALGATPLLEFGMRLGEGSAAALAWPLVDSACRLLNEVASLDRVMALAPAIIMDSAQTVAQDSD